jgi:hypothetical protein
MKIALIGFGKMGREIETVAREQGETIARVFEIDSPVRPQDLADVDVCIDFSTPDSVLSHIRCATEARRTSWWGRRDGTSICRKSATWLKTRLLYSSNFSLGMNIFFALRQVLPVDAQVLEYDPYIEEIHHRQKADSPSGTAEPWPNSSQRIDRRRYPFDPPEGKIPPKICMCVHTRRECYGHPYRQSIPKPTSSNFGIQQRIAGDSRRCSHRSAVVAAQSIYTMDDVEL